MFCKRLPIILIENAFISLVSYSADNLVILIRETRVVCKFDHVHGVDINDVIAVQ